MERRRVYQTGCRACQTVFTEVVSLKAEAMTMWPIVHQEHDFLQRR